MRTTQTHAAVLGACLSVALAAVGCSRQPTNATTAPPPVIGLDGPYLDAARARAESGDRTIEGAIRALEQDAAKALAMTPVSVMDKEVTPPSGDKHDYMSQAPYWWPDPAKPDGRPYIRATASGIRRSTASAITTTSAA